VAHVEAKTSNLAHVEALLAHAEAILAHVGLSCTFSDSVRRRRKAQVLSVRDRLQNGTSLGMAHVERGTTYGRYSVQKFKNGTP
jgi:hypothetical protein